MSSKNRKPFSGPGPGSPSSRLQVTSSVASSSLSGSSSWNNFDKSSGLHSRLSLSQTIVGGNRLSIGGKKSALSKIQGAGKHSVSGASRRKRKRGRRNHKRHRKQNRARRGGSSSRRPGGTSYTGTRTLSSYKSGRSCKEGKSKRRRNKKSKRRRRRGRSRSKKGQEDQEETRLSITPRS